jgi:hypothetical protein
LRDIYFSDSLSSEMLAELGPSTDGITVESIMQHWDEEFGPDTAENQLLDTAAGGDIEEVVLFPIIHRKH